MNILAISGRNMGRAFVAALALGGFVMAGSTGAMASPRGATAPGAIHCTDDWNSASSGSWNLATNWSTGIPTSSDNACITVAGTYTVTLNGNATASTLTLGGSSGTQTLKVQGNASSSAVLSLSASGSKINSKGVFALDAEAVADAGYAEVSSGSDPDVSLSNHGTFETLAAPNPSSPDYVGVDLTNTKKGTVSIGGANTEVDGSASVDNSGHFTITSKGQFLVNTNSSFTQSRGTLVNDGTMVESGAIFTQSGGTDSGNPVELTQFSSLIDSAGAGSFTLLSNESLSGTVPVGQTVTVIGNSTDASGNTDLASNVINDGTFVLDSESSGDYAQLSSTDEVYSFTNNGTFEAIGSKKGTDHIAADVINNSGGAVSIGAAQTDEDAYANVTNNGTFVVTSSGGLYETGGSEESTTFTQSGGKLTNSGTMLLNSASFDESGGAESGNAVTLTDFSTLTDSAGTGTFSLMDNATLNGTIPAGQTVTVTGNSTAGVASANLGTNITNDGTFILDSEAAGDTAEVNGTGSTVTNNGTFESTASNGGSDIIDAPLTNDSGGAVTISALTDGDAYQTITNNGTLTVTSAGELLTMGGSEASTVFDNAGTIDNEGVIAISGANFNNNGTYEATFGVDTNDPSQLTGGSAGNPGYIALGGILKIITVGSPATGTMFDVVGSSSTDTSVSGTFSSYQFGSEDYSVSYSSSEVTAEVE